MGHARKHLLSTCILALALTALQAAGSAQDQCQTDADCNDHNPCTVNDRCEPGPNGKRCKYDQFLCPPPLNPCEISQCMAPQGTAKCVTSLGECFVNGVLTQCQLVNFHVSPPPSSCDIRRTFTKTFGTAGLPPGGTTSMTIQMSEGTPTWAAEFQFADMLPAGLTVANPSNLTLNCGGFGVAYAPPGSSIVSLAGGFAPSPTPDPNNPGSYIPGTCQLTVDVTAGMTPGLVTNTVSESSDPYLSAAYPGNLIPGTNINNGSVPLSPASANLYITDPVTVGKVFSAGAIPLNASTQMTITLSNPNAITVTNVAITDPLPPGLAIAIVNGLSSTCGGTVTAAAGSTSVALTGGSIAATSSCTITVNVRGTSTGVITNITGNVSSTETGTNSGAQAIIEVAIPPMLTKSFGAVAMPVGSVTTLVLTIGNPNSNVAYASVGLTDNLPPGLMVAAPNGLSTTCAGTAEAIPGSDAVSLSGATLAASSSCTITVNVIGTAAGTLTNTVTVTADTLTSDPAIATITVGNVFQISYASNLNAGDSVINITNAGTLSGLDPNGRICANFYAFDPAEEMIDCCSCLVTPNGLDSLSAQTDLIANPLTPGTPSSIVIKLLGTTLAGASGCDASAPSALNLEPGLYAWGTTLHATAANPAVYTIAENPFQQSTLSATELQKLTSYCRFIETAGSGYGICASCRVGGLGATHH